MERHNEWSEAQDEKNLSKAHMKSEFLLVLRQRTHSRLFIIFRVFVSVFFFFFISKNDRCSLQPKRRMEYEWAHKRRGINNKIQKNIIWYTFVKLQQTHSYAHFILIYLFISFDFFFVSLFSDFLPSLSLSLLCIDISVFPLWLLYVARLLLQQTAFDALNQSYMHKRIFINITHKKKFSWLHRLITNCLARDPLGSVIDAARL